MYEELLKFEVIPSFSRDLEILVYVSSTFNLNIAEKVVKENYKSCAELDSTKCIATGCPKLHRSNGKPSPTFNISSFF